MNVKQEYIKHIPSKLTNQFSKLTLGRDGTMQSQLRYNIKQQTGRAFWVTNEGRVVAWALAFYGPFNDNFVYNHPMVYFYTDPFYRRQGYGSKVLQAVKNYYDWFDTAPHDNISDTFFIKNRKVKGVEIEYYLS